MIYLFRKIRHRLLSENRFGRYIFYAIGEILIVIIGILIAIQINNWNELRKEEQVRKNYLNQLLVDFKTDKAYYASRISHIERRAEKYKKYLDLYAIPNVDVHTILAGLLKIEIDTWQIDFTSTTISTLISTGDMKLLPGTIRDKLTYYHGLQNSAKAIHKINMDGALGILESLSMITNIELLIKLQHQPQLRKYLENERNLPKIIIGGDSYLQWRHSGENKTLELFKSLTIEADSIIAIINKEMEK